MTRRSAQLAGAAVCAALALLAAACRDRADSEPFGSAPRAASSRGAPAGDLPWDELIRVSDGDTIVVRYHEFPLAVRLLGVDTAESVHPDAARNTAFGEQTSAWVKEQLASRRIRVAYLRRQGMIATDRHHRALAWLWVEDRDGSMRLFNETLIEQGWSRFVDYDGDAAAHADRLRAAESVARGTRKGLWAR